ncbi:MAG: ribose 5-phosphate isomerase B [Bacteroidales bacterium]|nr:ribose 5-phosphate isomerase B [Bacteroidales bacterium]
MSTTIGIASDHAGFELKRELIPWLEKNGYTVKDFGANSSERSDYPDFGHPLATAVEKGECRFGVGICGTGIGISITMNKHQGIRAALCWEPEIARLTRAHNDANVLSLPARFISTDEAKKIVDTFLSTSFDGGRHAERIRKIPVK